MKSIATLTLSATTAIGLLASSAWAADGKVTDQPNAERSFVTLTEWSGADEDAFRLITDDVASKESATLTAPPAEPTPPAAPRASTTTTSTTSTVRMVMEAPHPDEPDEPGVCVFVPAGDEAGGALSCPGGNVRLFEFGPDHGREFIIGDQVMNESEIRALVEARIAEVNARLAENGEWNVEVIGGFDGEQYQQSMEVLARQMEQLQREMETASRSFDMSDEDEMAEFQIYMQDFHSEMQDLAREMSSLNFDLRFDFLEEWVDEFNDRRELQQERAELARELAEHHRELQFERRNPDLDEEDRAELAAELRDLEQEMAELEQEMAAFDREHAMIPPVVSVAPQASENFRWVSNARGTDRQVIRMERDGEEHVTVIENRTDDDGNPRVVIRTTNPEWVDVVHIDADEYDDE